MTTPSPTPVDDWHQLEASVCAQRLQTNPATGLTHQAAAERFREAGPNELVERGTPSAWGIAIEQLTSTMVMILIVAAAISLFVGDLQDAIVILVIVVLNAGLGFLQEFRAEQAIAALKELAVPVVRVRRGGVVREVSARTLVHGDVMLLEAGNIVAADGRLIESASLQVQEAALTGEAEPVHKDPAAIHGAQLAIGDRRNIVHMGTVITYGRGIALVTATGVRTELGRIATMLQTVEREMTPLQRRLDQLGRNLAVAALGVVALIFVTGLTRKEHLTTLFMTAISMAVAAVPEGLPAVVTIALALGAQRMLRRRALVRRLSAVETLGSVTTICSDKTGTLTENKMQVAVIQLVDAPGEPAIGAQEASEPSSAGERDKRIDVLLTAFALCNDASTQSDGTVGGDPTEAALLRAAARFGLDTTASARSFPRIAEVPFDSKRKLMSTVHELIPGERGVDVLLDATGAAPLDAGRFIVFTKGAADRMLGITSHVWSAHGVFPLDNTWSERIVAAHDRLAANGMRVLGVGLRRLDRLPDVVDANALERNLVFVGLAGLVDPPRPEVKAAVDTCKIAGIRLMMITGDHPLTARYVARELGIVDGGRIVTGAELDAVSDDALVDLVENANVFARVSPEHKLRLVTALQRRGHTVAMTGDGVNDAPALKKASIGVAMGMTGTDVSKSAADIVLLDDNFATIVAAVEEGRVIYDNIRKFVKYLLTTNSAELLVMAVAPFLGMPLPLIPLQILWINLVTDGPTALMLGVEPPEPDVMLRPPTPPDEAIFSRALVRHVIIVGLLMTTVCLAPGFWYWRSGDTAWQTMIFTSLALVQMGHVLAIRSNSVSLFRLGLLSNPPLLVTVVCTIALQFALIYLPAAQGIFGTVPLSALEVLTAVAASSAVFAAVEFEKLWLRKLTTREAFTR